MQKTTFKQSFKQFFMMTASLALAVVLLGGVKAAAASTEVTTEQGTFTIGYGGSGYNKYDAPTVIGYKGSESDVSPAHHGYHQRRGAGRHDSGQCLCKQQGHHLRHYSGWATPRLEEAPSAAAPA